MMTYTFTITTSFDRPLTPEEIDAITAEVSAQFEANDDHPDGTIRSFTAVGCPCTPETSCEWHHKPAHA